MRCFFRLSFYLHVLMTGGLSPLSHLVCAITPTRSYMRRCWFPFSFSRGSSSISIACQCGRHLHRSSSRISSCQGSSRQCWICCMSCACRRSASCCCSRCGNCCLANCRRSCCGRHRCSFFEGCEESRPAIVAAAFCFMSVQSNVKSYWWLSVRKRIRNSWRRYM